MNIRQVNKMINQELSLLTKRNIYVGGDTDEMSVESDRVRGEKRRREPSEERTNRLPFH